MACLQGAPAWRRRSLRRSGEDEGIRAAASAAALAATSTAAAATAAWEGEEQELSSLQESTALIPDVSNSMVTLMDERMELKLGKFSGFFFIRTHNAMPSNGRGGHTFIQGVAGQPKHMPRTSLRCCPLGPKASLRCQCAAAAATTAQQGPCKV